jgi:fructokinase
MKKFDVTALGELLIDFTENGLSSQGNTLFEANPGGAPCNVLAMLTKLGRSCAFVSKVGEDLFGHLLHDAAAETGVCMDYLLFDKNVRTTLAFVKTFSDGDRDFSFYRNPGADMCLREEDLPLDVISNSRIFHFGTLSMTHEGVRRATNQAVGCAKKSGALISFDPNLRPPLWDDLKNVRIQIECGLSKCDILKIADNELEFMTGTTDFDQGAAILRKAFPNIRLMNVTAGGSGSYSYYEGFRVFVPALKMKNTIETTGAGDTFCACVLNYILEHGLSGLKEEGLREMLTFANTAAALITTRKGALRVMPSREEINELLL